MILRQTFFWQAYALKLARPAAPLTPAASKNAQPSQSRKSDQIHTRLRSGSAYSNR